MTQPNDAPAADSQAVITRLLRTIADLTLRNAVLEAERDATIAAVAPKAEGPGQTS